LPSEGEIHVQRLTNDEVQGFVAASPQSVYDLVSDVTRTPEWSPEVIECRWLDGADRAVTGARFRARNKRRWLVWANKPVVEVAAPPTEFAVSRTERGAGTIRWGYRLVPEGAGTRVTTYYEVVRTVPLGLHVVLRVLFGVRDLRADLHQNLLSSLDRLGRIAEAQPEAARADELS
jgi:Polyketide cyclase / dehydrase and lipid transport